MKDEIIIKKKEIELLGKKAGEWGITAAGESYLDKLIELKDLIDKAMDSVKEGLLKHREEMCPDLTTIKGKKYTAYIRTYGDRYQKTDAALSEFLKEVSYRKVDSEKVEEYKKINGKVPSGIIEHLQEIKVTFRKK